MSTKSLLKGYYFSLHSSALSFLRQAGTDAARYCHARRLVAANMAAVSGLSAVTYLFN